MAFYFKNTKKDILMTEKDEEHYRYNIIYRFYEREITMIKLETIVI